MKAIRRRFGVLLCGSLLWGACIGAQQGTASQAPAETSASTTLPLEQAWKQAQVGGKYRMLLRQIKGDKTGRAAFEDLGYRTETRYAGYTDLPSGYWVYVHPYWYIWRDTARTADQKPKRAWGPEQATGAPDTPQPGDYQTAWASNTPDGSDEWLMLEYEKPVIARSIYIYESFNPGAVVRVTAFGLNGQEVEVYRRTRVVIPATPAHTFRVSFATRLRTNRVKIYLDSRGVPGWNEIDAVGLREVSGGLQWARAAHASSIYGVAEEVRDSRDSRDPRDLRIRELEDENRRLRSELEALRTHGTPVPDSPEPR